MKLPVITALCKMDKFRSFLCLFPLKLINLHKLVLSFLTKSTGHPSRNSVKMSIYSIIFTFFSLCARLWVSSLLILVESIRCLKSCWFHFTANSSAEFWWCSTAISRGVSQNFEGRFGLVATICIGAIDWLFSFLLALFVWMKASLKNRWVALFRSLSKFANKWCIKVIPMSKSAIFRDICGYNLAVLSTYLNLVSF